MAIQFDSKAEGSASAGAGLTIPFTAPSGENRVVLAYLGTEGRPVSCTATYGGLAMTEFVHIQSGTGASDAQLWGFYLVNPPVGANNLVFTLNTAAQKTGSILCYTGVDVLNPIGTPVTATQSSGTTPSVAVTSQADWLIVDALTVNNQTMTVGAGQTQRVNLKPGWWTIANSEEAGAGTVTMSWTLGGTAQACLVGVPLIPARLEQGRAISYFFDVWDPEQRVLDEWGARVEPWDILPDRWIAVMGWLLPTSRTYDTFVEDPRLAYIEAAEYDDASGQLAITASRGELSDVILARASQGSNV